MNSQEVQRAKNVITHVRDLFVARVAQHPNAPATVRDALLDVVSALRTVERRMDAALDELERSGGRV